MANGYRSESQGDLGWLVDELRGIRDRLSELETPTGTSMNSLVAQVQEAIANIDATVTAAISENSYTKAEIDSKDSAVAATAAADTATRVAKAGDTMTGDLYLPSATAATFDYVALWLNGDGRVSKGTSSKRFKTGIREIPASALGNVFPPLSAFAYKGDPTKTERLGVIAEDLDENPDTRRFVVYEREVERDADGAVTGSHRVVDENGRPVPESVDFTALLLTQVAVLNERLTRLERFGSAEAE